MLAFPILVGLRTSIPIFIFALAVFWLGRGPKLVVLKQFTIIFPLFVAVRYQSWKIQFVFSCAEEVMEVMLNIFRPPTFTFFFRIHFGLSFGCCRVRSRICVKLLEECAQGQKISSAVAGAAVTVSQLFR